jgi:predicted GNAT superfamily acetyltransferase
MHWVKFRNEVGSALLEFVTWGLLLNVAILALTVQVMQHFQAQFASESIVRHVSRALTKGYSPQTIDEIAKSIGSDFSIAPDEINLQLECKPQDCNALNQLVTIRVGIRTSSAEAVTYQSAPEVLEDETSIEPSIE